MIEKELIYGETVIKYDLVFGKRKHLRIEVEPNQHVIVKAPIGALESKITEKVLKRASWIAKQIRFFGQVEKTATEKEYVSGETFWYLGRQYRLKVIESKNMSVRLSGGYFLIETPNKQNVRKIESQLEKWYREHAEVKFSERIRRYFSLVEKRTPQQPTVEVRKMKNRWGSCTKEGKIILNPMLIKAPTYCIDYVIIHELAHLIEHNHSPRFYQLKSQLMPDWKERKRRLEELEIW